MTCAPKCLPPKGQKLFFPGTGGPILILGEGRVAATCGTSQLPCCPTDPNPTCRPPQGTIVFFAPPQPVPPPGPGPRPPPGPGPSAGNSAQTCINECPDGTIGEPISVTVPANTYPTNEEAMAAACAQAAELRLLTPCVEPVLEGFAMWSWGASFYGLVGPDNLSNPQLAPLRLFDGEWAAVAGGAEFLILLQSNGTLWHIGWNNDYQAGGGVDEDQNPILFLTQIGTDSDWVSIAVGREHCFAVKEDGTAFAWGNSEDGQCGVGADGDTPPDFGLVYSPTEIAGFSWTKITSSSQSNSSIGIDTSGLLHTWGDNGSAQLGLGDDDTSPIRSTPQQVGIETWSDCAMGEGHALAIKSDKTLWGWGYNSSGELGLAPTLPFATTYLVPFQIGVATDWKKVFAGEAISFAIKDDDTLWSCGAGSQGMTGQGGTANITEFTQVGTDTWKHIVVGDEFVIGQKMDNTLWGWGQNDFAQLGQGAVSGNVLEPIQIGGDDEWDIFAAGHHYACALRTTLVPPDPPPGITTGAFGGVYSEVGGNSIHSFLGGQDFIVYEELVCDILLVGGGGEGGGVGGGGGGEVVKETGIVLAPGTYAVQVGVGGSHNIAASPTNVFHGANGTVSSFNGTTAAGGGGGGGFESTNQSFGRDGGNGGGGGTSPDGASSGGTGTAGFDGGDGAADPSDNGIGGGGGGGAGGAGQDASGTSEATGTGGDGGAGLNDSITGSAKPYGAGGGGGGFTTGGVGGSGVGGNGPTSTVQLPFSSAYGESNTGSGGGGGFPGQYNGKGGSGIVIISYPTPP